MKEEPQRRLLRVDQIPERHPGITPRMLRHWIAKAKVRVRSIQGRREVVPGNGFDCAVYRKGRAVFIDEIALLNWLDRS
jgi:hypothetical protein